MTSMFSSVFNELQNEKGNSDFKTKDKAIFALAGDKGIGNIYPQENLALETHSSSLKCC